MAAEAGNRYVYDITDTSNYNVDVEAEHEVYGMVAVANLVKQDLAAVS